MYFITKRHILESFITRLLTTISFILTTSNMKRENAPNITSSSINSKEESIDYIDYFFCTLCLEGTAAVFCAGFAGGGLEFCICFTGAEFSTCFITAGA